MMVVVKNVRDFAIQNEEALKRFMRFKTGIYDEDIIRDTIQEFYVKLIETRALEKFDEKKVRGKKERGFDTFICNLFCWLLPIMARRNFRARFEVISTIRAENESCPRESDVWDHMGPHNKMYQIDERYRAAHIARQADFDTDWCFNDFFEYVERCVDSPKKMHRMRVFLNNRKDGCTGVEIAEMLSVSNNMINIIKSDLRSKFESWHQGESHN